MKYGIIDVGSNSVRMGILENGKSIRKIVKTTQIADGLATKGVLSEQPMLETAQAILKLKKMAISQGSEEVYVFATEAVRSAPNGQYFASKMRDEYDIPLHILSGDEEAATGFFGAYKKGNCCVVDIGGASTEIIVGGEKGITYNKSMPIGVVRIRDLCGENKDNLLAYIKAFLSGFGNILDYDEVIAIGGTATTIVAINEKMQEYDPTITHNYILTRDAIMQCYEYVSSIPLEKRYLIPGLPDKKARVICGGALLLSSIMEKLKVDKLTISEEDNIEGYYKCFLEKSAPFFCS